MRDKDPQAGPEDPAAVLADLARATDRLLATAAGLSDADIAGPSRLPGWTRGHVLSHVARNADAMTNLLTWARTGVPKPAYPSRAARDAGIQAGAARTAAEQVADIRAAADRFAAEAAALDAEAWAAVITLPKGPGAARQVPRGRLREVEVHHVDLDAGYGTADLPATFVAALLEEITTDLAARDGTPPLRLHATDTGFRAEIGTGPGGGDRAPLVSGPAHALAGWLIGRTGGTGLTSDGPLPAVPDWI